MTKKILEQLSFKVDIFFWESWRPPFLGYVVTDDSAPLLSGQFSFLSQRIRTYPLLLVFLGN